VIMEIQTAEPTQNKSIADTSTGDGWADVLALKCTLSVALRMPRTTVADLLRLEVHSIIDARESEDAPLPVWVNGAMIGWAEFDVVGDRLAIRVTELR